MNTLMLIVTGGLIAMGLQLIVVDGITGWIASRIILRPWQHAVQALAIRYLYRFAEAACVVLWAILMIYMGLLDK